MTTTDTEQLDRAASERREDANRVALEISNQHAVDLFWALALGWVKPEELRAAGDALIGLGLEISNATYPEQRFNALRALRAWTLPPAPAAAPGKFAQAVLDGLAKGAPAKPLAESQEPKTAERRVFVRTGSSFTAATAPDADLRDRDSSVTSVSGPRRLVHKSELIIEPRAFDDLRVPDAVRRGQSVYSGDRFGVALTNAASHPFDRVLVLWHGAAESWVTMRDLRVPVGAAW